MDHYLLHYFIMSISLIDDHSFYSSALILVHSPVRTTTDDMSKLAVYPRLDYFDSLHCFSECINYYINLYQRICI